MPPKERNQELFILRIALLIHRSLFFLFPKKLCDLANKTEIEVLFLCLS